MGYLINVMGGFGHFGWSGVLTGGAVVFFAYIGFDAVSTASQEAINPKRDMPIGILVSLVVCTILYIAVSLVLTGIVNYKELNVSAPIAVAIDTAGKSLYWLRPIIKVGAIAGLSSVVLVLMMGQSRIFYSMQVCVLVKIWLFHIKKILTLKIFQLIILCFVISVFLPGFFLFLII